MIKKDRSLIYKKEFIDNLTFKINYNVTLDNCIICFNNFEINDDIRKLNICTHIYHKKCIKEWIINYNKSSCPLCRQTIY